MPDAPMGGLLRDPLEVTQAVLGVCRPGGAKLSYWVIPESQTGAESEPVRIHPQDPTITPALDRRRFVASLGGVGAIALMSHEARADAIEAALMQGLPAAAGSITDAARAGEVYPKVAEIEAQIPTRPYRRGVGGLFINSQPGAKVTALPRLPAKPTLLDFFALRFDRTRNHCLQSANKAMQRGADEEVVLACLLHDTSQELMRADHGFWGAQLYEPYVSKRVSFAIRFHQALRAK